MSAAEARHVVLIGMMGVGKSTVGHMLAARLGWAFWDNDEALQAATGQTAAEFQRLRGQAALHEAEDRLLREALRSEDDTVYAAAGSVVLNPAAVAGALTVWLRASVADEERQIERSGQHHRPLTADPADTLERLAAARLPAYVGMADVTVDVVADAAATCGRVMRRLSAIIESA